MDLALGGKVALVTGGSRGIGRSIVRQFAQEGCHVAFCARGRQDLEATAAEARALGVSAHPVEADLTRAGEAGRFVREAAAALRAVDLLVASAGASFGGGLSQAERSDWENTLALNLLHAAEAAREVAPRMAERGGGSIVLVSFISGRKPVHRRAQYGAAKAALIHLARSLALELAPLRIRVNSVSPGSVLVLGGGWERSQREESDRFDAFLRAELPWGRLGKPEEIADVVTFLLSERASWINAADVPVDGAQGRPSAF